MFDLNTNFFELFELDIAFDLNLKDLKSKYIQLQRKVHPDNFASGTDAEQRIAMQRVSYLNQAHDTLKSPLKRAIYLLECSGQAFDPDTQVSNDPIFLMEQMELREALSEIPHSVESISDLDVLRCEAKKAFVENQNNFIRFYKASEWSSAGEEINKMMFVSKFIHEITEKEEVLFD